MVMNEQLFSDNQKWAVNVAYQYLRKKHLHIWWLSRGEVSQSALIGLWKATNCYNPMKGLFRTYAYYRVVGELKDQIRQTGFFKRAGNELGINDVKPIDFDIPIDGNCEIESMEASEVILGLCRPEHKDMIRLHYVNGLSVNEIVNQSGLSERRVYQILDEFRRAVTWNYTEPV
jgi:RNA polymerase sigma factor (sigma-70 family)